MSSFFFHMTGMTPYMSVPKSTRGPQAPKHRQVEVGNNYLHNTRSVTKALLLMPGYSDHFKLASYSLMNSALRTSSTKCCYFAHKILKQNKKYFVQQKKVAICFPVSTPVSDAGERPQDSRMVAVSCLQLHNSAVSCICCFLCETCYTECNTTIQQ